MNRGLTLTLVAVALWLFLAGSAPGHGGGHPTPWPVPPPNTPPPPDSPVPPPPPPPGPTPEPEPEPTPEPDPDDPDDPEDDEPKTTPNPKDNPRDRDPRWTTDLSHLEKSTWKQWWEMNKWRFTWTPQRSGAVTGGGENETLADLVSFLEKQLDHSYFDVRSAAVIALGKAGAAASAEKIRPLLRDSSPVVVESAILALGMVQDQRSVPDLLSIFQDSKRPNRFRVHAAVALGLIGDNATAKFLQGMVSRIRQPDEVRAAAMLALALQKNEASAPVFVAQIGADRVKRHVKAMAATALGKLGLQKFMFGRKTVRTVPYLAHLLQTRRKDHGLRQSSAMAIAALGPKSEMDHKKLLRALTEGFTDKDSNVRNLVLMAVAEIAYEGKAVGTARRIIHTVLAKEKNQTARGFACLAAGLAGDRESVPRLRQILTKGSSPELRAAAAVGLGLLKDFSATPTFLGILGKKGGETTLKGYCCTALGIMGIEKNKEALPVLKKVLSEEADPELRAAAAMALTRLNDRGALDIVLEALTEKNQYFRMSAVMAVGRFRDLRGVGPLIRLYESGEANDELKAIVCVALGNIAETSEIPVFRRIGRHYNFLLKRFRILDQIIHLL
jgi:HEAT repeat protein